MPNKPRDDNRGRVIRIEDSLWDQVKALAEGQGKTPSEVVREAVRRYVKRPPKP